jgi:hypothetical protein
MKIRSWNFESRDSFHFYCLHLDIDRNNILNCFASLHFALLVCFACLLAFNALQQLTLYHSTL